MEIVPKPPRKIPSFEKILSLLSFCLFLFAIFSFLFFFFSVRSLNLTKTKLEKKIPELETPEIKEMKEELAQLEERFSEIENLLNLHSFPSRFFPFLENKILKKVVLSSVDLNLPEKKAEISGFADDFSTLSKQYFLFKQSPEIENAEITSVAVNSEGKVEFKISFSFKEEVIK